MMPLGAMTHERHPQFLHPPSPTDHDDESKGLASTPSSLDPSAGVCRFTAQGVGKS